MKKFLTTFSALAAAFGVNANANVSPTSGVPAVQDAVNVNALVDRAAPDGRVSVRDDAGNTFNFILRPAGATGQLMAYHESHSSHSSHRSHSSHYSSRY